MKSRYLLGTVIIGALTLSPAMAREKVGNHTLGSASDVWRVELRNLESFEVLSSGDDDGVSELRSVTVTLRSPEGQSHYVTETNPYFRVSRTGTLSDASRRSRDNSVNVRVGDKLYLDNVIRDREARPAGYTHYYNLWLHTRERPAGDIERSQIQFEIEIKTRELDCAGDRVCRRGSTGTTVYQVSLPVPEERSLTCNPRNTLWASGGDQLTIQPRWTTRDRYTVNAKRSGSARGGFFASGVTDAVHLEMTFAEICIAATRRV